MAGQVTDDGGLGMAGATETVGQGGWAGAARGLLQREQPQDGVRAGRELVRRERR